MKNNNPDPNQSFDVNYTQNKEMFGHPYQELRDYFKKLLNKGSVLDLGCGQERDSIYLASIGFDVTAVDSSKIGIAQMLEQAKEKGITVKEIVSDILNLELKENFDIILFDIVLHSFEKRQQIELLRKYIKNLEDKGIICIVYPDDMSSDHFMSILNSILNKWTLKDKIIIKDVPKLPDEKRDYVFEMTIFQRNT